MYSLLPLLYFFLLDTLLLLSSCWREGVRSALPGLWGLLGVSSPSRRPCGALLPRASRICFYASAYSVSDIFFINIINNFRTRFIMSFYMICAVIYCLFYCIYVWLDLGTYMIARFMSFYKPGVTLKLKICTNWEFLVHSDLPMVPSPYYSRAIHCPASGKK